MKRFVITFALFLFAIALMAQVPAGFSYQAVVRNNDGEVVSNQEVRFRFNILRNSPSGIPVYTETHDVTTSDFGLANLNIGRGTVVDGIFSPGGWGLAGHFLKTELDVTGGSDFIHLGTMELMSVPYAFHAQTVEVDQVDDADADTTNELQELELSGTVLGLSKSSKTVILPSSGGGDNWGTDVVHTDATLEGQGTTAQPLKIAQEGAATGEVLKWSGSTWAPAEDLLGSSYWLQSGSDIYFDAGHVGIGTDDPLYLLHVYGTGLFKGSNNGISIGPNGPAGSINFHHEGGMTANITLDRGKTTFYGLVGIGTQNPDANLHVDDNIRIGKDLSDENVYGELIHQGSVHGFKINSNAGGQFADMYLQTDGTTRLLIESGGNVGIGTIDPGSRLHIKQAGTGFQNGLRLERSDNQNWWSIQINNFNDLVFDYKGTNTRAWIDYETAGYNHSSDRNLKTDINSIKSALNNVMRLNPVTFRFKSNPDSENVSYGLIAQEVEKVYPEFVSENNGNLGIAYHNFSVVNIKAIQEQQEQIILLQKQIEKIVKQNKELKEEITQLKTTMNSKLKKVEEILGTVVHFNSSPVE